MKWTFFSVSQLLLVLTVCSVTGWAQGGTAQISGTVGDAAFYAYARPEPDGFAQAIVRPAQARYDASFGIFVLPYEQVRTSAAPEGELMTFLESSYEAAARLAQWDRESLER